MSSNGGLAAVAACIGPNAAVQRGTAAGVGSGDVVITAFVCISALAIN